MNFLRAFLVRTLWQKSLLLVGLVLSLFLTMGVPAEAATGINRQLNYQAKLSDAFGFPVPDGTYNVKFTLYDAASGGTALWSASGTTATPVAMHVQVVNGLFTVVLGDTSASGGSQNALNDAVAWNSDSLYLGVTIGSDGEMSPRKRMTASPYAFNAEQLQGMYASGTAFGANSLFVVNQTSNTAATGTRSALEVRSAGTSNTNDFLIRGINDLNAPVFTVDRAGGVTSTNLSATNVVSTTHLFVNGTTTLGAAGGETAFAGRILSDLVPRAGGTQTLGASNARWNGYFVGVTTTNLAASGVVSSSQLYVNGSLVCLADGTNCLSSGGSGSDWTYNAASGFVRLTTSTNDLVLGNTATSTGAASYFDLSGKDNGTSTVYFGFATNTNVVLGGTSTTQTGLKSLFRMDGDDLYVHGNIGSVSSVYTNGAFVAGTSSTFFGDGFISKNDGVLTIRATSGTRLLNSLDNRLSTQDAMQQVGSVALTQGSVQNVLVRGRYAYAYHDDGYFSISDITDPTSPTLISTTFVGADAGYNSFEVAGNYLYYITYGSVRVYDITNPKSPRRVGNMGGIALSSSGEAEIVGSYLYIASGSLYYVINITDPTNPFVVTFLNSGLGAEHVYQGGYDFIAGGSGNWFVVMDVHASAIPSIALTSSTLAQNPSSLAIQGKYLYLGYSGNGDIDVIDVTSSTVPVTVKRFSTGLGNLSDHHALSIQGRYLYVLGDNNLQVYDVSVPASPTLVNQSATLPVNSFAKGIAVSGRYAYIGTTSPSQILAFDILGIETNGLAAASAEFGTAAVRSDAVIGGRLDLLGGLTVGLGGIHSNGALMVRSLSTSSTFAGDVAVFGAVSSTSLYVGGQSVCLSNGVNCTAGGSSATSTVDFNWRYTAAGDFVRQATSTSDLVLGNSVTSTGATTYFDLSGGTNGTGTVYFGFATNTNVVLGGTSTTQTGLNSLFAMNGNDLFVNGNIGSASSVYTNGAFLSGTSSRQVSLDATGLRTNNYAYNFINDGTDPNFGIPNVAAFNFTMNDTSQRDIAKFTFAPGGYNVRFGYDGSIFADGYVTSSLGFKVGNTNVCLQDGTNCQATSPTTTGRFTSIIDNTSGFNTVTSVVTDVFAQNRDAVAQGDRLYVISASTENLYVYDIQNPNAPKLLGTLAISGTNAVKIDVQGRYAYIVGSGFSLTVVDVANPSSMSIVGTAAISGFANGIHVAGKYAYITDDIRLRIYDVSDPTSPFQLSQSSLYTNLSNLEVRGKYAYAFESNGARRLRIFDISNPNVITETGSVALGSFYVGRAIVARDGYVFLAADGPASNLYTVNVSNPAAPVVVATTTSAFTYDANTRGMVLFGDYLIGRESIQSMKVIDVHDPLAPVVGPTFSVAPFAPRNPLIVGNYLYTFDGSSVTGDFGVTHLPGMKAVSFAAGSVVTDHLQVLDTARFANGVDILSGLSVYDGISSFGALSVFSPNATSTIKGVVSTTQLYVSNQLVCLANGTNCPVNATVTSTVDANWRYNSNNNYVYQTTSTAGFVLGRNDAATEAALFANNAGGNSGTSTFYFGYNTNTNIVLGGTSTTNFGLSNMFVVDGNDLFVNGNIGSVSSVYTNGAFVAGTGTTLLGSGFLTNTNATFTLSSVSGTRVNGALRQDYSAYTSFKIAALSDEGGISGWSDVKIIGDRAYTVGNGRLEVWDIGNIAAPRSLGAVTGLNGPRDVEVQGEYAYIQTSGGGYGVRVFDISNPANIVERGNTGMFPGSFEPQAAIEVQGRYGYTTYGGTFTGQFTTLDLSDPAAPTSVAYLAMNQPTSIKIVGRYAYVVANGGNEIHILDLKDPMHVIDVATVSGFTTISAFEVVGKRLYIDDSFAANDLYVYDLSDASNPTQIANVDTGANSVVRMKAVGKYLMALTDNGMTIVDVGDGTAPYTVKEVDLSDIGGLVTFDLSGNKLMAAYDTGAKKLAFLELEGLETSTIAAGSAEFGTLQALKDARIGNTLQVGNGLGVGYGGISSLGGLSIYATDTTSTIFGNLAIGTSTRGIAMNSLFQMSGDSLLVAGNIGSVSSVYTNGEFVAGPGSTHFGNGYITNTSGNLAIGASGGYILPTSDLGLSLGDDTMRFNGSFGAVTSTKLSTLYPLSGSTMSLATSYLVDLTNTARNSARKGDYLFVTIPASDRVMTFDVSNPANPVAVATTTLSGGSAPYGIAVNGDYAYVANNGTDQITVLNISKPSSPTVVSTFSNANIQGPRWIYSTGKYAYVTMQNGDSVVTIDVTTPSALRVVNTLSLGAGSSPNQVTANGHYLLITTGGNGGASTLKVVNISSPDAPSVVGSVSFPSNARANGVSSEGRYAYVALYNQDQLAIIDLIDPTNPAQVGTATFTSGANPIGVKVSGRYAYVSTEQSFVVNAVDVTDPANPVTVATSTNANGNVNDVQLIGNYVYGISDKLSVFSNGGIDANSVTAHYAELGELEVGGNIDLGNRLTVGGNVRVAGDITTPGNIQANEIKASKEVLVGSMSLTDGAIGSNGELDISTVSGTRLGASTPTYLSNFVPGGNPRIMRTQGHYLYTLEFTAGKLAAYDIANPESPVFLDDVTVNGAPTALVIDGNRAYVGSGTKFESIDISLPYSLTNDGTSITLSAISDMVKVGNYVYAAQASAGGVRVIDVSQPTAPRIVGFVSTGSGPLAMATDGRSIYVADDVSNTVKQLSTGLTPSLQGTFTLTSQQPKAVAVDSNYVYVTTNDSGSGHLRIFSLASLAQVGQVALSDTVFTNSLALRGKYAYVTTDVTGLHVIDVSSPTGPVQKSVTNNGIDQPDAVWAHGLQVFVANDNNDSISVFSVGGLETQALGAYSAEIGQLDVTQNLQVQQNVKVTGGISSGQGLQVQGQSSFVNSQTSATVQVVNTAGNAGGAAWGAYINRLLIGDYVTGVINATGTANYQAVVKYSGTGGFAGLCLDDTSNSATCPSSTGGASLLADNAVTANAFDLAEQYALMGTATATDLLIQSTTSTNTVMVSDGTPYDNRLLGVYSTRPGFLLGWNQGVPVALTGRVPLKVSAVNGAITAGDPLTSSPIPGYAMKATHPGMVVGYALDTTSTTSTIDVFVKVGYDARMALGTDASGTITAVTQDLVFVATSTASATNPTVDSWGLTFRGSAWNGSQAVTDGYRFFTDILSATTSAFTLQNNSSTNIFTINKAGSAQLTGDLQIGGKLYPSARGSLQHDKYIYLDDSAAPTTTYMATNADGWQANSSYDFAERYYSPDALEPGDLVVVSRTGKLHVQRSLDAQTMLAGIVSTKPGFVTGAPATSTYPIALSGRVPTKVSNLKGAIQAGDPVAPSNIPGVAVKATEAGPIVGYALENWDGTGIGKIEVYVNPVWWGGDLAKLVQDAANASANAAAANAPAPIQTVSSNGLQGLAVMKAGGKQLHVSFASIKAYPNVQVTPRGEVVGSWWTDNYTDTGFDIFLKQDQMHDVTFAWNVTITKEGEDIFYSDGTAAKVDATLGTALNGTLTQVEATTTAPTSAPAEASTSTAPVVEEPVVSSTEPAPTPVEEPAPVSQDPAPVVESAPSSSEPVVPVTP